MKNTDLHTHTYYSDGELSPRQLVRLAKREKIKNLAITDHNSVRGIEEAIKEGEKIGVNVIPGVEIIVKGGEILGYFVDYKNKNLQSRLKRCAYYMNEKIKRKIKVLEKKGFNINYKKFTKFYSNSRDNYNDGQAITYLAKFNKLSREEAFHIWTNTKINKPLKKNLTPQEGIKLIIKHGGVAVLPHPWMNKDELQFNENLIKNLVKAGLKGLELENGDGFTMGRTKAIISEIKKIAKKYNLVLTSGSDFHGKLLVKRSRHHDLGDYNCDESVIKKLEKVRKIK